MRHARPKQNPACADVSDAARRISDIVDGYMHMGEAGMAEHSAHMELSENTLPMMTGTGPFGPIEMGGMFTVVKVRDGIQSYADPGWYDHPDGTVARRVDAVEVPEGLAL